MAGCRKPGRPSLEHRSMCVATALWVAAWFSLGFFTCETGSHRLASSQSCQLPFFFLNKVLLEESVLIAFCYHRNYMAYGNWNVASPSLEKSCRSLVCGAAVQTENDVTQSLVHDNCFHYIIIQVGKRLRSCKLERKCFNCRILQINESLTILEEALALRLPLGRWQRTSAWAPLYGKMTQDYCRLEGHQATISHPSGWQKTSSVTARSVGEALGK